MRRVKENRETHETSRVLLPQQPRAGRDRTEQHEDFGGLVRRRHVEAAHGPGLGGERGELRGHLLRPRCARNFQSARQIGQFGSGGKSTAERKRRSPDRAGGLCAVPSLCCTLLIEVNHFRAAGEWYLQWPRI